MYSTNNKPINHNSQLVENISTRLSNAVQKGVIYFGSGTIASVFSLKLGKYIQENNLDFTPTLPHFIYQISHYLCKQTLLFDTKSGMWNFSAFSAPVSEELFYRVILQEFMTRILPEKILNKMAPQKAHIVNSKIVKISRIAFSALVFSLIHAYPKRWGVPTSSMYRHVQTFAVGIILGIIQEKTRNPLWSMIFHSGYNIIPGAMNEAISSVSVSVCPLDPPPKFRFVRM